MRSSLVAILLALLVLTAQAAVAQQPPAIPPEPTPRPFVTPPPPPPDGPAVRRHVSDARALVTTSTCFYGPTIDQGQAKRLCAHHSRAKLLDTAVSQLAADPEVAKAGLSQKELRAFIDSMLTVHVINDEVRAAPDGLAVRLSLEARMDHALLSGQLAAFTTNPKIKAAALDETAKRDRLAAEARMAAIPFGADREFRAREMEHDMDENAAFAERRIALGMSMRDVKELMGNPATIKQSAIGAETYVCAGYGRVFVVFRDGAVACLRSRLDFLRHYGTDCHCAGNYATILKND